MAELVRAFHAHLVDFMSLKGLFTAEERSYARGDQSPVLLNLH